MVKWQLASDRPSAVITNMKYGEAFTPINISIAIFVMHYSGDNKDIYMIYLSKTYFAYLSTTPKVLCSLSNLLFLPLSPLLPPF